jgi:alpha-L-arabinofuranosidase
MKIRGLNAPILCILPLLAIAFAGSLGASDALIEIDAARPAAYKIPRTIYGTFLEPIGHSIYPGLWAQILENPSFEDNLWSMRNLERMVEETPALTRASSLGLPLPWQPLDAEQGARYEPLWNDAANSYRSLGVMSLPGKETGVRQTVYLPVHRVLRYNGSIYIKHLTPPAEVEISLRRHDHPENVLARVSVAAGEKAQSWSRHEFKLALTAGQFKPLEPADFVISVRDGARALIDQVLLFPDDAVDDMDPDMIALARDLRSPVVRFGGNFTSAYHWRDGVGPMEKRVTMLNQAWGMPEYNHFGTDEFLRFCERIGAQPQIALNLGTGTPEEAAGWVSYVNQHWGDRKGGLLWELGNELWGTFQIGYPTLERIAGRTRDFSAAVRAVDPRARLIATGADPDRFRDWNAAQLSLPPGTFDFLSTHFVVRDDDVKRPHPEQAFIQQSAFALPVGLERRLREMKQQIDADASARGHVGIAFTEWLFHGPNDNVPRFNNLGGALCAAGFLNTLIRVADFTPIADMTGLVEFGGIWKKRGKVFGVPAYWAFRMYSTADATTPVAVHVAVDTYDVEQGNKRIPEIRGVPYLDVVAALNDSGDRLTLFCVNRNAAAAIPATLKIAGFRASGKTEVETLSGPNPDAVNSEEHPDAIQPRRSTLTVPAGDLRYTFPAASVTVMHFR